MKLLDNINAQVEKTVKEISKDSEQLESTGMITDAADLLNSGIEISRARKEKEKKDKKQKSDKKTAVRETKPMMTLEECCKRDLERARERGFPEPDWDYRNLYQHGQYIWFVRVYNSKYLKSKYKVKLFVRTVYPRLIVGVRKKAQCECIGYSEREQIFLTEKEANDFMNSIDLPEEVDEPEVKPLKKSEVVEQEDSEDNEDDSYAPVPVKGDDGDE